MAKITNVLSLFDGLSCGQIALKELGIRVSKYYASEIDKYAIAQTMLNFPDTIQLGSVTDVDVSRIDKIDLLIGGSPCLNFSFAGKRNGMSTTTNEEIYTLERYLELKNNGFQFEGESFLFWEYMRILNDIRKYNPNVKFFLENVEMGKKWEKVITDAIGIEGIHINAALVSAQNRKRIYWTNIKTIEYGLFGTVIPDIPQPKDRGILLKDILEDGVDEKYYLNADVINKLVQHRERHKELGHGFGAKFHSKDEKMQALKVGGKGIDDLVCIPNSHITCLTPKRTEFGKQIRRKYEAGEITAMRKEVSQLELRTDGKTNTLTTVQKDNLIMQLPRGNNKGGFFEDKSPTMSSSSWDRNNFLCQRQQKNFKGDNEKANTFLSTSWKGSQANGMTLVEQGFRIRRLTPTECSRLQTIPEWYKWKQLFKTYYIWQQNAELKIARGTSRVRNQDCVTYTTYDLSELEQQTLEKQLINLKNAPLRDVTESVQPMQGFALCTTSVLPEQDPPNYWKEKASIKNFALYVEYISKGDADQQKDCAPSITEALLCMGMNVKLIEEMNQEKIILILMDTMDTSEKNQDTERYMKIILDGNLKSMSAYTISILINLITELKTYISAKTSLRISGCISNYKNSQGNSLGVVLSGLKMDVISLTSDTQAYKMLGNGWCVEVIKHIFQYLK